MRQSNSARCRRIAISCSRRTLISLLLPATLDGAPEGSGLMLMPRNAARMAARLRSVLHDSHASRTGPDGGVALMTVGDPVSRRT
jgi:hypothetical protein